MSNKRNPLVKQAKELQQQGRAKILNLESFNKVLNSEPPKEAIKSNRFMDGAKYIPISFVENWLDEMYLGLWSVENMQSKVIANEICVSLELKVYHPVAGVWITRLGAGASMIRQAKGARLDDINSKIKNALVQDFGHAKSEAFKNAAKSLGKKFGRDINRDFSAKYQTHLTNYVDSQSYDIEEVKEKLKTINDPADLVEYWESRQIWQQDPAIKALFDERQKDILDEQF